MTNTQAASPCFAVEPLEGRQLLSGPPWGPYAVLIGQDQAVAAYPYLDGSNETVALIDRGVDYRVAELGGGVGPGFKVIGGYNFRDNNTNILDDYGHGTGVASIIAAEPYDIAGANYNQGVADGTKLIMLKQESSAQIKQALDWVIANHTAYNIQVVNLTDFVTDVLPGSFNPSVYADELQQLHNLNIFVCTPVGNGELYSWAHFNGPAAITDPALNPYVMGAGGVTQSDTLWNDSRRGNGLDILGPSENVSMIYYLQNKVNGVGVGGYDQYDDNSSGSSQPVTYAKGTSWASAYVSGTAALLKQINPNFTPDQIMQILTSTGTPVQDPENPGTYYPRLNIYAALTRGFQLIDDPYFGNNTMADAAPLSFNAKGQTTVAGLKLTMGHPDCWSFNVNSANSVSVKVKYTAVGKGAQLWSAALYDGNGNFVTNIKKGSLSRKLAAGEYIVEVTSGLKTLPGSYSLNVSGKKAFAPAVGHAMPAIAVNTGTSTVFSTQTSGADSSTDTTSGNDLILGKTTANVFA
jgi:hypothetical protein